MLITFISIIFIATAIYLAAGILFTIIFQAKGLSKIDEGVHGSSWAFKIIIIPGCIVFWPVLLRKWIRSK
ncbi:hypothetical protein FRZ67_17125 [Panacibacter ginsenosidivorans]|uniref:Uncharacterized protein n=1 Tax=Panacibacter ginsenosidivorans TaxID=1813871 RepID=A0A5B8VE64_9BACT|nr:hypothetical protein [Panacibacter ginsenosidivorans]QEC68946.1 hypothetical protein FRZ67_17125 [Panacibacter ginsenosidivorans]